MLQQSSPLNRWQLCWCSFLQAGMFITRFPLGWLHPKQHVQISLGHTAIFFAPWGSVIAFLALGIVTPLWWFGMPWQIASGLLLMLGIVFSGALHEDGLADCCDGFWGGRDPEHRHRIMKDSSIGSYGTLALMFSIGLRWAGLALLDPETAAMVFILMHTVPRGCLGLQWSCFPLWKTSTSLAQHPPPAWLGLISAAATAVCAISIGAFILQPLIILIAITICALCMTASCILALLKLGGLNGDCFGAAEQVGQMALLLVFILLTH